MLQFPIFQNYVILKRSTERGNFIFMKNENLLTAAGVHSGLHRVCGWNGKYLDVSHQSFLYGGGSFLIPYFIFVALIGFTGVIGEMSFGRGTRSGPLTPSAWPVKPNADEGWAKHWAGYR